MEEKWIYGILTVQAASQFYPFARKDQDKAACFLLVCQDLRDQLLSTGYQH